MTTADATRRRGRPPGHLTPAERDLVVSLLREDATRTNTEIARLIEARVGRLVSPSTVLHLRRRADVPPRPVGRPGKAVAS